MKKLFLLAICLVAAPALVFGGTSFDARMFVKQTGSQHYGVDSSTGVSQFNAASGATTNGVSQAFIQASGGSLYWTVDAIGPVTGTTGFLLEDKGNLELDSLPQILDFRWKPVSSGSGATIFFILKGE